MPFDLLAFDRESVRSFDQDGRLHVAASNISKANICPYYGSEIPDAERLGLEPDRQYRLLRDPSELAKAAPTFNNLPVLSKHVPVSAEDHQPDLVVGSTGTDAEFSPPFLRNSLVIWAQDAIRGIETGEQRELSCAYRYDADMTPGEFLGEKYDGVMRNIRGNHVALVPTGRAGADVVVGDAAMAQNPPHQEAPPMAKKNITPLSRRALVASAVVGAALRDVLAKDAKIDLRPMLADVKDAASWATAKPAFVTALHKATKGKLAQDASLDGVIGMLDKLEDATAEMEPDMMDPEPVAEPTDPGLDADPIQKIREFLAGKLSDEDMAALEAILAAKPAEDAEADEEDEQEKKEDDSGEKKPPFAKDNKGMVSKGAMDKAIKDATKLATDAAVKRMQDCRIAEQAVVPFIGRLPDPPTDPAAIYRLALDHMRVDLTGIPESAYGAVLRAIPQPGAKPAPDDKRIAQDAEASAGLAAFIPGIDRIRAA